MIKQGIIMLHQQEKLKDKQPNRLSLSTAVAAALLSGYGSRQAFAGNCTGAAGTYSCSGAANSATDTIEIFNSGNIPLTVTTTPGFGIDTSGTEEDGMFLRSLGSSLTFTDLFASSITGDEKGLHTVNDGSGVTSITSTGIVTGVYSAGIYTKNSETANDLSINAFSVNGKAGINAINNGTGKTSITTNGTVTGHCH